MKLLNFKDFYLFGSNQGLPMIGTDGCVSFYVDRLFKFVFIGLQLSKGNVTFDSDLFTTGSSVWGHQTELELLEKEICSFKRTLCLSRGTQNYRNQENVFITAKWACNHQIIIIASLF